MKGSSFPGVVFAIDALRQGSERVGRTHVQKLLYLAEGWDLLPKRHAFTLYLHGPYSRDLDGELLALRAAGVVTATPDAAGYGANYAVSERHAKHARDILAAADLTQVETLARTLGRMGVRELEAISTCEFVKRQRQLEDDEIVSGVKNLKPHLSEDEIFRALEKLKTLHAAMTEP